MIRVISTVVKNITTGYPYCLLKLGRWWPLFSFWGSESDSLSDNMKETSDGSSFLDLPRTAADGSLHPQYFFQFPSSPQVLIVSSLVKMIIVTEKALLLEEKWQKLQSWYLAESIDRKQIIEWTDKWIHQPNKFLILWISLSHVI